ncbi:MAG: LysM peptidoglycan-binding domain-containing protein, partial [Anaerolineae bacterium]
PTPSPVPTEAMPATVAASPTSIPSPDTVASSTATPTIEPSSTPLIEASTPLTYVVAEGDSLLAIAVEYDVSLEALMAANEIEDEDFIRIGETLTIPSTTLAPQEAAESQEAEATSFTETLEAGGVGSPDLETLRAGYPAQLGGDLAAAYPAEQEMPRFTVHYVPATYPEEDLQTVTTILERALQHIESSLGAEIQGGFDVYVPGSLFGPPNQHLRGRSFSANRYYFFLHDSTGNLADQQYIATHEMTHLFTWNVFGRPVSAMLSEGVAVYMGMTAIADADHLAPTEFCGAYHIAGRLPRVTSDLRFEGHIRDLGNYYAAGCFVQYLIESYGAEKFGSLYPTGDYLGVYGQTLAELEEDWIADLEESAAGEGLDSEALLAAVDAVGEAYDDLISRFSDNEAAWSAYVEVDAARIALLEGRFDDVTTHLTAAERHLEGM